MLSVFKINLDSSPLYILCQYSVFFCRAIRHEICSEKNYSVISEVDRDVESSCDSRRKCSSSLFLSPFSPWTVLLPIPLLWNPPHVGAAPDSHLVQNMHSSCPRKSLNRECGHMRGMAGLGTFLPNQPWAQHFSISDCSFRIFRYTICVELEVLTLFKCVCFIIGNNLLHFLAIGWVYTIFYYFTVNKVMTTFHGYLVIAF